MASRKPLVINAGAVQQLQSGDTLVDAGGTNGFVTSVAEFTTDNAVARIDGTTGRVIQGSTLLVSDTGVITQTDPAVSPAPVYISLTTLAAVTFEIRVYTAGLASLGFGVDAGGSVTTGNNNIFIGKEAGKLVTSGSRHTLVGAQAGAALTTVDECVFIGAQAGENALGAGNTGIGYQACRGAAGTFTGTDNICIGPQTGFALTTGVGNMLIGEGAGAALTTASAVVAIGTNAGELATTTGNCTFIGTSAGRNSTATANIGIGTNACRGASAGTFTGGENTCIGNATGAALTTGNNNMLFGSNAGAAVSTGTSNACVGASAGETMTVSTSNVLVGGSAGRFVTGDSNVGIGVNGGRGTTGSCTGDNNVSIGRAAGLVLTSGADNVLIGRSSGDTVTTGTKNVCIGFETAGVLTTGTDNVLIGADSGDNASQKVDAVNTVAIGSGTFTTADNTGVLGNTSMTAWVINGGATINEQGLDQDTRIEGDTLTHMIFCDASAATENIALVTTAAPNWQSMDRGLFVGDMTTAPSGNPSAGVFLYSDTGDLKIRNTVGAVTQVSGVTRGATASVADGGTITHNLGNTPTGVLVTTTVSGEFASVTALSSTTATIAIKKHDNTAGTTQTIYWEAFE